MAILNLKMNVPKPLQGLAFRNYPTLLLVNKDDNAEIIQLYFFELRSTRTVEQGFQASKLSNIIICLHIVAK